MLDAYHTSPFESWRQEFSGAASVVSTGWRTWVKPRGITMVYITCIGGGGGGGNSVAGAASSAAGGGGGGSSGHTMLWIPASQVPDTLYVSVGLGGGATSSGIASVVRVAPSAVANDTLIIANGGSGGGTAVGSTAGAAGGAGAAATIATMPLGFYGIANFFIGQAGIIGGTTVAGAALTLPVTGIQVTGGTGGGGLPAANNAGTAGGLITGAGVFNTVPGGAGGTPAGANPGQNGLSGVRPFRGLNYGLGGTGGGSGAVASGGASGGAGGVGGSGAPGCGGGGGGGGFTGSAIAVGGKGGDGYVLIICT